MSTHHVHVFISHSWSHSSHYQRLHDWLFDKACTFGQARVQFYDYSVPKDDPIHNAPRVKDLEDAILRKIARSHVVIIPTGMYANYSKWIAKEIRGSRTMSKPILAVNPRAQQRTASIVTGAAAHAVGWTRKSVVEGIWRLYRQS